LTWVELVCTKIWSTEVSSGVHQPILFWPTQPLYLNLGETPLHLPFTFLWMWTPGVNFTNIFTLSFYVRSSQKRKSHSSRQCLFTLLGSASLKAVRRTLVKLSPDRSYFIHFCRLKFVVNLAQIWDQSLEFFSHLFWALALSSSRN